MFLRSITIRGFKSFADKTVLDFIPGTSVIVGPNGSGKSNLVDAISWALGEQGARALRGGQMADVIFAGTPSRPALGMAEVKLLIDNGAGKIAVPMPEIEVSRTIFRSGDSEYRINGKIVRLMDVQELLSESGIGRALHTVVGQGQLEEVLLSRPEDRRKYIEEAAGIAKHRRRKERAERKLASSEHDLLRLQDVLAELRRQLKPLRQQAEMAKRHEQLTAQAEELAVRLAAARLRGLRGEKDRRAGGWDEGTRLRTEARARLDSLDEEVLAAADARALAAGGLLEADRASLTAQSERSRAEEALRTAVQSEAGAREALAAQAAGTARLDALDAQIGARDQELSSITIELAQAEARLTAAESDFRDAEEARREMEEARRRIGEAAAGRRAELETMRRSLTDSEREAARVSESLAESGTRARELETERDELSAEIEKLDSQSTPLSERRTALDAERRQLVERIGSLEEAERADGIRSDLLEARRRDIEETAGTRFMAEGHGRSVGLLRDLVRAREGLDRALATAIGPLADAVVYEDGEAALADADRGNGAILAVSRGGPVRVGLAGERSLLSAVDAEPPARGIVSSILADVYLAESLEEAVAKQAEHPEASFVTLEGVMVGAGLIHTASGADDRSREIRAELAVLDHDLAATRAALKPRRERLAEIAEEVQYLREQLDAADGEITSAAERMARLEAELVAVRTEREVLDRRLASVQESATTWRAHLDEMDQTTEEMPELPPRPQAPLQDRVLVETLRRDRIRLESSLSELRAERDEIAARDPSVLRDQLTSAETNHRKAAEKLEAAERAAVDALGARDEAAHLDREAGEKEANVNRGWREASAQLDELRERFEDEDRARGDLERRIGEAERLLREGHGRDPDEALALVTEEDTIEGLEKKADLVQRRLALLGRVNLLATGEFEALQERHDFMQRELEDVRAARRDLLEVIARVDREISEAFDSAYRDVAEQFTRIVKDLFPGGDGRLVLTDPAQPLESGIEIEASPGRKRVRRISLLSGGERSLVALAFLFAIFTARPSPFYLMDEVEPALDDVNLHRFLRLVSGFAADAQVLIVTHQKRTMEIAGMMYGVSLAGDGTTKIVCQRMEDTAAGAGGVVSVPDADAAGDVPGDVPKDVPGDVPEREAVG